MEQKGHVGARVKSGRWSEVPPFSPSFSLGQARSGLARWSRRQGSSWLAVLNVLLACEILMYPVPIHPGTDYHPPFRHPVFHRVIHKHNRPTDLIPVRPFGGRVSGDYDPWRRGASFSGWWKRTHAPYERRTSERGGLIGGVRDRRWHRFVRTP